MNTHLWFLRPWLALSVVAGLAQRPPARCPMFVGLQCCSLSFFATTHFHSSHCSPCPAMTPVRLCAVSVLDSTREWFGYGIHPPCTQVQLFLADMLWWLGCGMLLAAVCFHQLQLRAAPGHHVIRLCSRACTRTPAQSSCWQLRLNERLRKFWHTGAASRRVLQCADEASREAWVVGALCGGKDGTRWG